MLDIAAVLVTSAITGTVAEASGAPAHPSVLVSTPFGSDADPTAGPEVAIGPDGISELRGIALLDQFELLTAPQLRGVISTQPALIADLLAHQPLAVDTAEWWEDASPAEQATLTAAAPQLVGNLEGIPYAARDAANRAALQAEIERTQQRIASGVGRAEERDLRAHLHTLQQIVTALQVGASSMERHLLAFDPAGEGLAAVSIGDLATADYVGVLVPGMYFKVDGQMVDWTTTADDYAAEQLAWLNRLGQPAATVAAVSWLGYHTPAIDEIVSLDQAVEGSEALTGVIDGLGAARATAPYLTIVGHSYGSTAAMLALQAGGVHVDALAVVGSPGAPAHSVADLAVPNGNVWVGAADWDFVQASGLFGSQPSSAEFGARSFSVAGGVDPVTGATLAAATTHTEYFSRGSESLRNLALIGLGRTGLVQAPHAATPGAAPTSVVPDIIVGLALVGAVGLLPAVIRRPLRVLAVKRRDPVRAA